MTPAAIQKLVDDTINAIETLNTLLISGNQESLNFEVAYTVKSIENTEQRTQTAVFSAIEISKVKQLVVYSKSQ